MRAALLYGAGDVRVETVPDPAIQRPTDAIVRVMRSCVCGTDLHPYHDMAAAEQGVAMGHEFLGVVEDTGSAVKSVQAGDLVVGSFCFQDNTCENCRRGLQSACEHGGFISGAQAELLLVPQAEGTLVVLPPGVDDDLLPALLSVSDVYGTGYHAARSANVGAGDSVAVIGDGAVGLLAVLAAKQLGAEQVILMGRHQHRTDLGREFGATDVVPHRGEEGIAAVDEISKGGVLRVIDAVGERASYDQAVGIVRAGGVISRVGVPQYEEAPIGYNSLFAKNITLTGGVAPVRAYMEELLPGILDRSTHPGRVFDRVLGLEEVASGYRAMDDRTSLKVLLE